jgi:3-phenylpropionate/cinnamic acid dioxygenase small subunit
MSDRTIKLLTERLDRLEAERAIVSTLYTYGSAIDYGNRDRFLDCFTADAEYVVTMRVDSGRGFAFHGHDELTTYFDSHTHAPAAWHKHVTTNPSITVDGNTAVATSYFLRVDADAESGPAVVVASGRYLDDLVRDEGGQWRIRSRRCEVENL